MPKRHTYVATCIKETPIRWGMELESLGDPIPLKVVRFPYLTQPLTRSPHFQSGCDPTTYFRQLVKGMPEMLRGYHAQIIKKIQRRLDQLQVGDCCYIKVSYIDNGGGISPYNYNIELIETSPHELHCNFSTAAVSGEAYLPSAVPSIDNLYPPATEEIDSDWGEFSKSWGEEQVDSLIYRETDPVALIGRLHEEIRRLQADMDLIKEWIAEAVVPSDQSRTREREAAGTCPNRVVTGLPVNLKNGEASSHPPAAEDNQRKELPLDSDERNAIQYLVNQQIATESQLGNACHISNLTSVMGRLIEKMERCNFPWISVEEDDSGELIYIWNAPIESR